MDKDEALKMALEALESLQGGCTDSDDGTVEAITVWCPEVIDAIREALAQPEQEPVVCPYCKNSATLGAVYYDQNCLGCVKRMTVSQTPPPCPTCEALARTVMLDQTYYDAQRKPLTDEQIEMIGDDVANEKLVGEVPNFRLRLARAIEAAHGIKGE